MSKYTNYIFTFLFSLSCANDYNRHTDRQTNRQIDGEMNKAMAIGKSADLHKNEKGEEQEKEN